MADYKRMVSYMYQYENGIKKKNVGYARVEAKNGQCKITLHLQLLGQLDSIFPTYLIQRDANGMELIYLGDALLKNQVMDSKLTADEKNIMNSGHNLSDMGGLLLFMHDNVFFATEWDDKPIVTQEVLEALKPKKQTSPKEDEKDNDISASGIDIIKSSKPKMNEARSPEGFTLAEEINMPKYMLPRGWKTIERFQKPIIENIHMVAGDKKQEENKQEDQKQVENKQEEYKLEDNKLLENNQEKDIVLEAELQPEYKPEALQEFYSEYLPESDQGYQPEFMFRTEQETQPEYKPEASQELKQEPPNESKPEPQQLQQQIIYQKQQPEPQQEQQQEQQGLQQEPQSEPQLEPQQLPPLMENQEDEQPEHPTAKHFFDSYPRIYPFEDNEIILSVKIEPKDIGMLPKDLWALSNNSFLMHGFYCYHHLIFAKMKDRYGCRYILGIPGIYHNRERFMARMFGLESFKSIRKRELQQGDFGYWYLEVNF